MDLSKSGPNLPKLAQSDKRPTLSFFKSMDRVMQIDVFYLVSDRNSLKSQRRDNSRSDTSKRYFMHVVCCIIPCNKIYLGKRTMPACIAVDTSASPSADLSRNKIFLNSITFSVDPFFYVCRGIGIRSPLSKLRQNLTW